MGYNTTEKKTFITHRKRRLNTPKNTPQSSVKSMLLSIQQELGLNGLLDGEVSHTSFDCPINLREAFKQECWANGKTECEILRGYMAEYIIQSRVEKHAFGNTLSKIVKPEVHIGSINLSQTVQRSRRLPPSSEEAAVVVQHCSFSCCEEQAIVRAIYHQLVSIKEKKYMEKELFVCRKHFDTVVMANPKNWFNVTMVDSTEDESDKKN